MEAQSDRNTRTMILVQGVWRMKGDLDQTDISLRRPKIPLTQLVLSIGHEAGNGFEETHSETWTSCYRGLFLNNIV